ncbi:Panacea domain-containing protein [Mammaliicoccus sciuri]|uniref:Panacea domain-containing protein n=1 Tax=Mammaliicoccus sciuri TaxID=1296 RepID=UPI00194EA761|nr:type II toxin-antitoxin system antitoxin SocA domain-containing protein [Mammaliicoccus sciuri]
MNMSKLATHIINLANKENGRITNLQLQKVLYFVIGDYIKEHGINKFIENVYDEKMEAWQYGPVLRNEYFKNSIYGSSKIRREVQNYKEFEVFDEYIKNRIDCSLGELIDESHEHKRWADNQEMIIKQNKTIYYNLEDFENEFRA